MMEYFVMNQYLIFLVLISRKSFKKNVFGRNSKYLFIILLDIIHMLN
jgi:hypothetical protein